MAKEITEESRNSKMGYKYCTKLSQASDVNV
jgi:hypothetical protein